MDAEPTLIFEALYAEIERLKAELEIEKRHWVEDDRDLHELCSLITELCDALVYLEMTKHQQLEYHNNTDLIQRAREAVK